MGENEPKKATRRKKHLDLETLKAELSYDPESGLFTRRVARGGAKVGDIAGSVGSTGYVDINVMGHRNTAHRLAVFYMTGEWPPETVDHINRVRSDNRWCNLRCCDMEGQGRNRGMDSRNTSGHSGVYFFKPTGRWMAAVFRKNRQIHLGYYATREGAIEARQKGQAALLAGEL